MHARPKIVKLFCAKPQQVDVLDEVTLTVKLCTSAIVNDLLVGDGIVGEAILGVHSLRLSTAHTDFSSGHLS